MKEKKDFIVWVKQHKKELIIAGLSVMTIVAIILGIKHFDELKELWNTLRGITEQPIKSVSAPRNVLPPDTASLPVQTVKPVVNDVVRQSASEPFDVSKHLRNLHTGWHASPDKIATALENGFVLEEGQTWVTDFTKGAA